jgi:patatin-like phospholipase/acyl hydrolase
MASAQPLRILSLDGGGVRGIASLYVLQELMRQVRRDLQANLPTQQKTVPVPLRPCDYFDLIGGTSTGGLIAIMLGRLRYVGSNEHTLFVSQLTFLV